LGSGKRRNREWKMDTEKLQFTRIIIIIKEEEELKIVDYALHANPFCKDTPSSTSISEDKTSPSALLLTLQDCLINGSCFTTNSVRLPL